MMFLSQPAFVHSPCISFSPSSRKLCVLRKPKSASRFFCSATPTPKPTSAPVSPPHPERQFAKRLADARQRTNRLHARLVFRIIQSATKQALTVLSTTTTDDTSPSLAVARRLRKDLRAVRSTIDDIELTDEQLAIYVERLQALVDQIQRKVDETTFVTDRVQENLEGAPTLLEDVSEFSEYDDSSRPTSWDPAANLRRRVTTVGQAIEGRVSSFFREDGSIDMEKMRAIIRRNLDSISMTWMRLNGRNPSGSGKSVSNTNADTATSTILTDSAIPTPNFPELRNPENEYRLREEIGVLEKKLLERSRKREVLIREEDQLTKLIRAREIRQMDDDVSSLRRVLAVRVLQLELEKIIVVVGEEIDSADYNSILDQRVLVIEFGDLDGRLATLDLFVEQQEALLIEDDVLGELAADIQDMKLRLGLDAPLYSSVQFSWSQVRQFLASSSRKTRDGYEFYSRGLRLFFGDLLFSWRLIRRAILGYTPSAREIRTLRRTGRDLLTLIPFTIVLIAPLTPVGHVLIFSFLQRYWPEFFPSTFSERRQTMMKKRELYLKALQDEEGTNEDSSRKTSDGNGRNGLWGSVTKLVTGIRGTSDRNKTPDVSPSGTAEVRVAEMNGATAQVDTEVSDVLSEFEGPIRDGDKYARKKRIMLALDELHLAD